MKYDNKDYFVSQYDGAYSDWLLAASDQERQEALDAMARIYNLAALVHGFSFADSLQKTRPAERCGVE